MHSERIEAFLERFIGFASGATTIGLLAIADRTGLSAYMGRHPSGTAAEIAHGAQLDERYVREILSGLAAAGVVDYEASTLTFTLPPEHAIYISNEESPLFKGGWLDWVPAMLGQIDGVAHATVHGGGVPADAFGREMIRGTDRGNGPAQRAFLVDEWLAAVPGLGGRLERGIRVADVGCGSGNAAMLIAEAYPNSDVVGYDISDEAIEIALRRAGQLPNVDFQVLGVEHLPLDPGFDMIITLDVIHDLADPLTGLMRIREALRPEGIYFVEEPNASSRLERNLDDVGAFQYGGSVLFCMTQSLAEGGAGLGTAWGREDMEALMTEAGFGSMQRLDEITDRFSAFYFLTP